VVLIDTPPALAAPDAQTIGSTADLILFAVKWGQTDAQALNDGLRSLRRGGLKVDGLILTQVDPKRQRHFEPNYHAGLRGYHKYSGSKAST
jgi:Mrp family chromosome partitioning ATPase